jgi:head-tail adaptor
LDSVISAKITIPWRGDLNPTMRIIHGSYIYDIAGLIPDNDSGREWLTIMVSNGKNSG